MSDLNLTKIHLIAGIWEGELTGAGMEPPELRVTHQGDVVDGLQMRHDPADNVWHVSIPIPTSLISDGVQTFIVTDVNGNTLTSFALLAGEALADDIRAELDLLRGELDMLKRSFRRHCSDA